MSENNITKTISLKITDVNVLYMAYMPFVVDGGIFIPTRKEYSIGKTIILKVHLLDEKEVFSVSAKVIWVTPAANQSNKAAGVGLMFHKKEGSRLKHKIETLIAPLANSNNIKNTHTI